MDEKAICTWAKHDEYSRQYHDEEWCVPHFDDRYLFEMLILEGAQAGLSWLTILKKREGYRQAFHNFDIDMCAALTDEELGSICETGDIIRNKLKIKSVRTNARVVQKIREEYGSFAAYIWHFTNGQRVVNDLPEGAPLPASSPLSETVSKDLKKRGAVFVGPVIIYSYLQAAGVIDDHLNTCPFKNNSTLAK